MYRYFAGVLMLILFFIACDKNKENKKTENASNLLESSLIKSANPIKRLNAESEKLISSWPEYHKFDELISQYQEITLSDALLNSVELSEAAKQLKDSIRVEKLDIPEVRIRLNVLYSETLRLADMSTIPTITEELVTLENNNVIDAFSALNLKINNMNTQDKLNEDISKFVDEVLEESKPDSITNSVEEN